jgi:hypothetical protein
MNKDSLPFLRFSNEDKLLEELPECHVQRVFLEIEILEILFRHYATEIVAMETEKNTLFILVEKFRGDII